MSKPTSEELWQRETEIRKELEKIFSSVTKEHTAYENRRRTELWQKWTGHGLEMNDEQRADYDELNNQSSEWYHADKKAYDNLPEVKALNTELGQTQIQWAVALVREDKRVCSSCYKPFPNALKRDSTPYKTCPRCRQPTRWQQAVRAAHKCANERDFLNCKPCHKNYAYDGSCLLSETVRLELIRATKAGIHRLERGDQEARMFGFDLAKFDAEIGRVTDHEQNSVDEMLGWAREHLEHLESYSLNGKFLPERQRWGRDKWERD